MNTAIFIAGDVGNRKLKYRQHGETWVAEDALVRLATQVSDDLRGAALALLTYLDGPAAIDQDPETGKLRRRAFLVGADALRGGALDLARVGTAAVRVASDPYKLLHLYLIARSLPRSVTHEPVGEKGRLKPRKIVEAEILFAGGLPGESAAYKPELLAWLKGTGPGAKSTHHFTLGAVEYRLRVRGGLIIPQHIAVTASMSFGESGSPLANGALNRKRLVLDAGGGTTDYGGNVGLDVIPGTEGSVRKGAYEIASLARDLLQGSHPGLQLTVLDMLAAMDQPEPSVFIAGEPVSVRAELVQAAELVANTVITDITPRWEAHLGQAEVDIAGGTGQWLLPTVRREFKGVRIVLLDDAIFRVGYGLERLGRHKLKLS